MAERRATVVAVAGSLVELRPDGPCSDCGGCGGRCNLFATGAGEQLAIELARFASRPQAGDEVTLLLAEGWLVRSAWRGYGIPLLGLLAGAGAGHLLALLAQWPTDPAALLGAAAGTAASFTLSKGPEPQIAVRLHAEETQCR